MVRKNKKGWIKIVEAFVAILLFVGILLVIISSRQTNLNAGVDLYAQEGDILKGFQINDSLRAKILEVTLPINSTDDNFPTELINHVNESFVLGEECFVNICVTNTDCNLELEIDADIYVREILILGDKEKYAPRIVKLFCY